MARKSNEKPDKVKIPVKNFLFDTMAGCVLAASVMGIVFILLLFVSNLESIPVHVSDRDVVILIEVETRKAVIFSFLCGAGFSISSVFLLKRITQGRRRRSHNEVESSTIVKE